MLSFKSISAENTFGVRTEDRPTLRACLREQAEEIAGKLARHRLGASTVQVKVRYGDFTTLTRQVSVEEPVTEAREIYRLSGWPGAARSSIRKAITSQRWASSVVSANEGIGVPSNPVTKVR